MTRQKEQDNQAEKKNKRGDRKWASWITALRLQTRERYQTSPDTLPSGDTRRAAPKRMGITDTHRKQPQHRITHLHTHTHTHRLRETETETHREWDRQTDGRTDGQIDRVNEWMNKLYFTWVVEKTRGLFTSSPQRERERDSERDRETHRERQRPCLLAASHGW